MLWVLCVSFVILFSLLACSLRVVLALLSVCQSASGSEPSMTQSQCQTHPKSWRLKVSAWFLLLTKTKVISQAPGVQPCCLYDFVNHYSVILWSSKRTHCFAKATHTDAEYKAQHESTLELHSNSIINYQPTINRQSSNQCSRSVSVQCCPFKNYHTTQMVKQLIWHQTKPNA